MASGKRMSLVLVVPRFEDIFHAFYAGEIIKGVGAAASRLKVDVLIHVTDRFDHRGWLDARLLEPQYIDGIIFGDIDNDLSVVKKAIRRGIPVMVLNNILEEPINYVAVDNRAAAREAVARLIRMGHTRIAAIAGDLSTQAGQKRLEGFKAALAEAGLKVPKYYVTYGDFLRTPARAAAERLVRMKTRPTAVFAASDVMALEMIDVARAHGLRVPEDLSVLGFDDNPINANSPVPLTTVAQPLVEMGRVGAEHLVRIRLGRERLPVKVVLPTRFVKGRSIAPLKR